MPDLPEEAVRAAAEAMQEEDDNRTYPTFHTLARVALEAAEPFRTQQEEDIRADERRKMAERFRALAARYRAAPSTGLTMGQLWDRDETAREYDRIAGMIEKGFGYDAR